MKSIINEKVDHSTIKGIKMSEFHSGKYQDITFETCPLIISGKFRKPKIFWHLPYWTAQKVKFEITIRGNSDKKLLSDIPIFVKVSNSKDDARRVEESNDCVLSNDGKKVGITTEGLRGSYVLEYYIGSPNGRNSSANLLTELRGNWRDSKWLAFFSLISGFIVSLIIFLLGLLSQAISINVELIADLF